MDTFPNESPKLKRSCRRTTPDRGPASSADKIGWSRNSELLLTQHDLPLELPLEGVVQMRLAELAIGLGEFIVSGFLLKHIAQRNAAVKVVGLICVDDLRRQVGV